MALAGGRLGAHPVRGASYGHGTVALASNPFAEGLDEPHGAVTVASLEDMPGRVEDLIANPTDLACLCRQAIASARAQVDWSRYVAAVSAAGWRGLRHPTAARPRGLGPGLAAQVHSLHDHITCFVRPIVDMKTRGIVTRA